MGRSRPRFIAFRCTDEMWERVRELQALSGEKTVTGLMERALEMAEWVYKGRMRDEIG